MTSLRCIASPLNTKTMTTGYTTITTHKECKEDIHNPFEAYRKIEDQLEKDLQEMKENVLQEMKMNNICRNPSTEFWVIPNHKLALRKWTKVKSSSSTSNHQYSPLFQRFDTWLRHYYHADVRYLVETTTDTANGHVDKRKVFNVNWVEAEEEDRIDRVWIQLLPPPLKSPTLEHRSMVEKDFEMDRFDLHTNLDTSETLYVGGDVLSMKYAENLMKWIYHLHGNSKYVIRIQPPDLFRFTPRMKLVITSMNYALNVYVPIHCKSKL